MVWNEINEILDTFVHYRLNWARITSWGRKNELDDIALQIEDSKFKPWRSEAELAISQSHMLSTIFNLYGWAGKKHFVSLKLECESGVRTRNLRFSKQTSLIHAAGPPHLYKIWILRQRDKFLTDTKRLKCCRSTCTNNTRVLKKNRKYLAKMSPTKLWPLSLLACETSDQIIMSANGWSIQSWRFQ